MMISPEDFSLGASLFIFWGLSVYFTWELRGNLAFRREMELARRQLNAQCQAPCDEAALAAEHEVYYIDFKQRSMVTMGESS